MFRLLNGANLARRGLAAATRTSALRHPNTSVLTQSRLPLGVRWNGTANKGPSGNKTDKFKNPGFFKGDGPTPEDRSGMYSILGSVFLIGSSVYFFNQIRKSYPPIGFQQFKSLLLEKGLVHSVEVVDSNLVQVRLIQGAERRLVDEGNGALAAQIEANGGHINLSIASVLHFEKELEEVQKDMGIDSSEFVPVHYEQQSNGRMMNVVLYQILPQVFAIGLLIYMFRGMMPPGGASRFLNVNKPKFKKYDHETAMKVKFSDVAGCDEAKQEIMEFVHFLKSPQKYESLGAHIPKGAILTGPPGTGKTMLARATAGEAGVPFFSISGSDFTEMFVGVGSARVRELFATARSNSPCIIFIDEIDAVGRSRSKSAGFGGNDERENTLNQLLVEMDGVGSDSHVIVLAGTNRIDVLDPALTRPGRFDRQISIDRPDLKGRFDIFKVHLKPIKLNLEDLSVEEFSKRVALLTPGFSGADIANVCNEAALIAARYRDTSVRLKHFEAAIERVIGGLEKKTRVLSPSEKKTVAYHEAGHAVAGWFLEHADPLLKVSIIPRSQALGYAQYLPKDQAIYTQQQLLDRMCMTLGGRVSEEIFFNRITTGAQDDLRKITQMAYYQIATLGMSSEVGHVSYQVNQEPGSIEDKPYSQETANKIDIEVRNLIERAHKRTRALLEQHKSNVAVVAERLLQKEVLQKEDMVELLGKRPFVERSHYDDFMKPSAEVATN